MSTLHVKLPILIAFAPFAALLLAGCGKKEAPVPVGTAAPATGTVVTTPSGIRMALLPAGEFVMGNDAGEEDEKPAHTVAVSAFYMDVCEVTQQAYESLIGKNPSKAKGPDRPVEQVDWYRAILYCNARSLKESLKPCYDPKTQACDFGADGYRLPTEAEWEYACRAGTRSAYSFGDDAGKLQAHAWFEANSEKSTHPVARKAPNAWGLFDMHGNVAEWCQDIYGESFYAEKAGRDPRGLGAGDMRVLRGGSWRTSAGGCRSSARAGETPGFADACFGSDGYGFRCVKKAERVSP